MFLHDTRLAYPVRVEKPNPLFAKALQQAIGGVEGEIRVMMQYLFQGFGARGPVKYRNMLLNTGTEEIGHIEMLATAVALNLEGAPHSLQEEMSQDPLAGAVLNGMNLRHILSTGGAATAENANGVPFNASHVYASGNIVSDMYANVAAESTGRVLACRLYEMTDDPGMKDMLSFLIARDTMHQQQWLAVIEELESPLPVPSDFPPSQEKQEFSHAFFVHSNGPVPTDARWAQGPAFDGRGEFSILNPPGPFGDTPVLAPAPPQAHSAVQLKPEFMAGAQEIEPMDGRALQRKAGPLASGPMTNQL